jgi:hypothetical protein
LLKTRFKKPRLYAGELQGHAPVLYHKLRPSATPLPPRTHAAPQH